MSDDKFQAEVRDRLTNLEKAVLAIQAHMTPKWLRISAWGAFAGAMLKELFSK